MLQADPKANNQGLGTIKNETQTIPNPHIILRQDFSKIIKMNNTFKPAIMFSNRG